MTTTISTHLQSTLYETDHYLWIENTLKHLENRDINNLDWQHLAEEIEALGGNRTKTQSRKLFEAVLNPSSALLLLGN